MTDDLHRSHPPATSPSIEDPAHTRPVTCNFTMHTAQWQYFGSRPADSRLHDMSRLLKGQLAELAAELSVSPDGPRREPARTLHRPGHLAGIPRNTLSSGQGYADRFAPGASSIKLPP